MLRMPCSCSSGTWRISKMPACLASTRNSVLSWILVVTVAVTVTSNTPSATPPAAIARLMSTCGCCCSSRICGEFGCSSDRSLRYMRWIWNTGVRSWSAMARGSWRKNQSPAPTGDGLAAARIMAQGRGRTQGHPRDILGGSGPVTAVPDASPRSRGPGVSGLLQQRGQAAAAIQRHQVVAAADMGLADEDLRHRAAAGQRDHLLTLLRVEVDAHLVDGRHAALLQQGLGLDAVGADLGGVHADSVHGGCVQNRDSANSGSAAEALQRTRSAGFPVDRQAGLAPGLHATRHDGGLLVAGLAN